jgi:hypothetical protein
LQLHRYSRRWDTQGNISRASPVRPARMLSPKPHFSYLDFSCLDARTLICLPFLYPLFATSFRYFLLYLNSLASCLRNRFAHRRVLPPHLACSSRKSGLSWHSKDAFANLLPLTSWSRNSLCHTIFTHALTSAYTGTRKLFMSLMPY